MAYKKRLYATNYKFQICMRVVLFETLAAVELPWALWQLKHLNTV